MESKNLYRKLGALLFSEEELTERISSLARTIQDCYMEDGEINVLPIFPSAVFFYTSLVSQIKLPIRTFPALMGDDAAYFFDEDLPKKILIITDMINTGEELESVGAHLLQNHEIEECRIATLLHKNKVPQEQIMTHFVGFHCPDVYAVGFGLGYEGYFRNLTQIYEFQND